MFFVKTLKPIILIANVLNRRPAYKFLGLSVLPKFGKCKKLFSNYITARNYATTAHELKTLSDNEISDILIAEPKLHCAPVGDIKSYASFLMNLGFHTDSIKKILVSTPRLLEIPQSHIQAVFDIFKTLRVAELELIKTVEAYPVLLLLPPEVVNRRIKELNYCFTKRDAVELLECCPNVYFEDWSSITQKVQYILFEMGFEQRDIIVSDSLKYNLEFIRLRHQALLRSGNFQKPNAKNRLAYKGITLKAMLKMSEQQFLKFAAISLQEYTILEKIIEEEFVVDNDSDEE